MQRPMRYFSTLFAAMFVACTPSQPPADLVFIGGHVTTTRATALAVRDGKITIIGGDAEVRRLVGDKTRVVNLAGRFIVASLTDAHGHMLWYGSSLTEVDLRGCLSAIACAERMKTRCANAPNGWVFGRGWDDTAFADKVAPTAAVLDAACPGRAVWLRRVDEHAGWANTAAMRAAGVTGDGVFVDAASAQIEAKIPPLTREQRKALLLAAQDSLVAMGLTSVHEMGVEPATEDVFRALARSGELKLRVVGYADYGGLKRPLDEAALMARLHDDPDSPDASLLFTLSGIKLWADGALGSRGAALMADYSDAPGRRGASFITRDQLERIVKSAIATDWQLAVHAIGDDANHLVLDAFEHAGAGGRRFRLEHAQVLMPADLGRFAKLGVIASMQPTHATSDMRWVAERIGEQRLAGAYAWQTLAKRGAIVVFGSDFPVESPNPWEGLYAATTRTNAAGEPRGGWRPSERLSPADALTAFTEHASFAAHQEHFRGAASAGDVADLTVIDQDVLADKPLRDVRVDMTVVGGRVVYER
ncbi:MAG: amidohydrolase [Clostridia bacterium]|nr:amidohydrolase [Deltaproteobacteria bacterium]